MIVLGLVAAAVFAIVLAVSVVLHERALRGDDSDTKPRVVPFELAGTGTATFKILDGLGSIGRSRMRAAIGLDRGIILGYAPLLAVLSLLSIWVIDETSSGTVRSVGVGVAVMMAVVALAAGLLDRRENAKLIEILDSWSDPPEGAGASAAAARQQHRRELTAEFDAPSRAARTAAMLKFKLLAAIVVGWGLTIACITVTHYVS